MSFRLQVRGRGIVRRGWTSWRAGLGRDGFFAGFWFFVAYVVKAPWDGSRQNNGVRQEGEREVQAGPVGALQLNIPDRPRVDLVARVRLAERPNRRATG